MVTKLQLFNDALTEIGHRQVSDTGETVESARVIVTIYDQVVAECLAAGSWNFAMETIQADYDTGVSPSFGYTKVFAKPSDWVRTIGVSEDQYFAFPLIHYYDDANYWSAENSPIYVRYVSDDTGLGLELTRWPATFSRYVAMELAARVSYRLTQNSSLRDDLNKRRDMARKKALAIDALNEPQPKFPPPGGWTQARGGRTGRERGSISSLTG